MKTMISVAFRMGLGLACVSLAACSLLYPLPPLKGPLGEGGVGGASGTGQEDAGAGSTLEAAAGSGGLENASGDEESTGPAGDAGTDDGDTAAAGTPTGDVKATGGAQATGGIAEGGASGAPGTCQPQDRRSCVEAALHGPCADGTQVCGSDGKWGPCSVLPKTNDSCVAGNDANCNGTPNEGCVCAAGSTRPCEGIQGNCVEGVESCLDDGSGWSACDIEAKDADSCDPGDDANCNGVPNEGCPCIEGEIQPCGPTDEIGICRSGTSTCTANGTWGECRDAVNPKPRDCRFSEDYDCDGVPDNTVDDVCQCVVGETQPCQTHPGRDGVGICKAGSQTCVAQQYGATSTWGACSGSVEPQERDCGSSLDNDCDGIPDNGTGGPEFVKLPLGYCIDSTEVTRAQYQAWLDTEPSTYGQPSECSWNHDFEPDALCLDDPDACQNDCDNHPQVCVDWCDAHAYCRAVNKRLCGRIGGGAIAYDDPSYREASQWHNACSSHGAYVYPYGDEYVLGACNAYGYLDTTVEVGTLKTCQAPADSGYAGVFDLGGNAMEWEDSRDEAIDYCDLRGGSFWTGMPADGYLTCPGGTPVECKHASTIASFRCCSQ